VRDFKPNEKLADSRSEEDEEEEEAVEREKSSPAAQAEQGVEVSENQPRKRNKNETLELVEYSPDELRSVDKEMLNAEITQLEGMSFSSSPAWLFVHKMID